ncbi:MAG: S8 family serine peptidase [Balneolales bacterium]
MKLFAALVIFAWVLMGYPGHLSGQNTDKDYLPGRVIVKFEPDSGVKSFAQSVEITTLGTGIANAVQRIKTFMQPYDLHEITPVFSSQSLMEVQEMKKSKPIISAQAIELAGALQRTFTVTYQSSDDPLHIAAELEQLEGVIYAEPHYIPQTTGSIDQGSQTSFLYQGTDLPQFMPSSNQDSGSVYIPNDPFIGQPNHNYFGYLNVFKAWGITKGSSDVIIAIIDTGVYYDHPDLKANLWRNPEPGRADELFPEFEIKDDTIGWNFWESGDLYTKEPLVQNADPVGRYSDHGTQVAGIAAAVTDNSAGIAGVGFQSKFMAVKAGGTKKYPEKLPFAYHSILYAAINGADVINCSFIGAGRSNFGTDVIKFAQEMGALVIAGMGNTGVLTRGSYPASYPDVLAVGAVTHDLDDKITFFSSYGPYVDVFAVGQNTLTTTFIYDETEDVWSPGYRTTNGTSLSTPMVSGLAALLKAEYPDWPPQRIASQIRATARSINYANTDPQYENLLGQGVIDAYAAMTETTPLISLSNFTFSNDQSVKFNIGESGMLTIEGVHFGNTSPEILFELESIHPGITIHNKQEYRSGFGPGQSFNIDFSLFIEDDYPLDVVPAFRLTWSIENEEDQSYHGTQIIEYEELLYGIMGTDWLTMTISSDGTLGFMHPEDQSIGLGFIPRGYENLLKEAGFMIAGKRAGEQVVINQIRDSTGIARHFQPVRNFQLQESGIRRVTIGSAEFHSTNHPFAKELEIEVQATALNTVTNYRTLFLTYRIKNNSELVYEDMHFGLFNYWKFLDSGVHQTYFSEDENLIYVSHEDVTVFAGIATTGDLSGILAIDNESSMTLDRAETREDSLSFGITYQEGNVNDNGFTDDEKRLALTSKSGHTAISAEDISMVIGTGPYTLYPQSEISIGFIYAWEISEERLKNEIRSAHNQEFVDHDSPGGYTRVGKVADQLTLHPNFPNPFNDRTTIRFDLMESNHVELVIYDLIGRRVATLVDEYRGKGPHILEFDTSGMATGAYMAILKTDGVSRFDKMMLIK